MRGANVNPAADPSVPGGAKPALSAANLKKLSKLYRPNFCVGMVGTNQELLQPPIPRKLLGTAPNVAPELPEKDGRFEPKTNAEMMAMPDLKPRGMSQNLVPEKRH